jgi:hypothetical protein
MRERWKSVISKWIPEGYYEVSNLGRVRSIKARKGCHKGRILKSRCKKKGRPSVGLQLNGKGKTHSVHQLVAVAFIGSCPPGKEVNHKDLDRLNNRSTNLEYITHQENIQHAFRNGCISSTGLKRRGRKTSRTLKRHYADGSFNPNTAKMRRTKLRQLRKGILVPKYINGKYVGLHKIKGVL